MPDGLQVEGHDVEAGEGSGGRKRMNVLLSAYACSPKQGSEEGVGWRWACEIARRGHTVTVLTRAAYQAEIESSGDQIRALGLRFVYLDLAPWVNYTSTSRIIGYPYIYLWQAHALIVARKLQRVEHQDLVHHLTFGGLRFPSFLWVLGSFFLFGPVGGGETSPKRLRAGYPRRGKVLEWLRDRSNDLVRWDPLMRMTFRKADRIVVRTGDNLRYLPASVRIRTQVAPECGIDIWDNQPCVERTGSDALRVLFVGRLIYWKGAHLAVRAVARARERRQIAFTCVGTGPDRDFVRAVAEESGQTDIVWIDQVEKVRMPEVYRKHDVLLFPSLHDSGANVVYEAATTGLPIVCLDLGAPGDVVEPSFGIKVSSRESDEMEVVEALAEALVSLCDDPDDCKARARAGRAWAAGLSWASRVDAVYAPCEREIAALADARSH